MTIQTDHAQQRSVRHIAAVAAVLLATAQAAHAQRGAPGSAPSDEHDCKRASAIVSKGKPDTKEVWAFLTVMNCPADVGSAGAAAIRLMRTVSDTAVLFDTWAHLTRVVDASIMAAYLEVLADKSSSPVARAWSAGAILSMESTGLRSTGYGQLTTAGADCQVIYSPAMRARVVTPLATGHRQTVRAALESLAEASDAPPIVKSAASCAFAHLAPSP